MAHQHKSLAVGRWQELSLMEQMGNIGSEVSRILKWQGKDHELYEGAFARALELLDLTIADPRWRKRLKELTRTREALSDAYFGGKDYGSNFRDLDKYFFAFAYAARKNK